MGLADKFLRKEPIPIITDTTGNVIKSSSIDNNLSIEDLDFLLQYLRDANLNTPQATTIAKLITANAATPAITCWTTILFFS